MKMPLLFEVKIFPLKNKRPKIDLFHFLHLVKIHQNIGRPRM